MTSYQRVEIHKNCKGQKWGNKILKAATDIPRSINRSVPYETEFCPSKSHTSRLIFFKGSNFKGQKEIPPGIMKYLKQNVRPTSHLSPLQVGLALHRILGSQKNTDI